MQVVFVDDDDQVRWVTQTVLESLGHEVHSFASASEALEYLESGAAICDCLLLDRNMPGMDGMSLLKKIRRDANLRDLPVIILTSSSSPEEVAEGLAAGAQLYLAKPAPKKLLNAALAQIESSLAERREVQDYLQEAKRGLALAKRLEFELQTLQEARQLSALLASLTADPERTSLGFVELLINGIEHGNLAISYKEKSQLLEENQLHSEIERRQALPEFKDKKVRVLVDRHENGDLNIEIADEGQGFDWRPFLDFCPDRAFDLHGRGIAISNQMAFDRMQYLGNGSRVALTILKNPAEAQIEQPAQTAESLTC